MGNKVYERYLTLINRPYMLDRGVKAEDIVDTSDHLPYFREVAKGNVVEIGCDVGNSTTAFLLGVNEKGGHVYSIDINPNCESVWPDEENWTFIYGNSAKQADLIKEQLPNQIDVLYIDGDHSYEGVKADFELYRPLVKRGGLILIHDVECPWFPGVAKFFYELTFEREVRHRSWGLGVVHV